MDTKKRVEITVRNDPEFRRVRGSGLWGAITPYGELQFNIFDDGYPTPQDLELRVPEKPGQVAQEQVVNADPSVLKLTRYNHIEVTMPMSAVPGIIQWLQSKVEEYEANQKLMATFPFWKEN